MHFRINDEVIVIAGADKGHKGKVVQIDRENNKIIVDGAAKVWKHVRKSAKNPQGGRLNKSMPMAISNVAAIDPETGGPTKVGVRYLDDGSKERFAKKSGKSLGQIAPAKARYAKK